MGVYHMMLRSTEGRIYRSDSTDALHWSDPVPTELPNNNSGFDLVSLGLGHMILFAQQMSRTDKVIVGIFAIGIAGGLTDRLFGLIIKRLVGETAQNGWD